MTARSARTLLVLQYACGLAACEPTVVKPPGAETGLAAPDDTGDATDSAETAETAETAEPQDTDDSAIEHIDDEPVWPRLLVNELMAANDHTVQDELGAWSDWVELYNPTEAEIDLEGWTVTDDLDAPDKHPLTGLSVAAGEHLLLWADGDASLGAAHLGFSLAAEGEAFGLYAPDGTPIDGLSFGQQAADISLARTPDGGGSWTLASPATPGTSNGG